MRKLTGISLVEMIVAIVIMAILAIAAFSYFHYCHRFIVDSQLRLIAVNFASETQEREYWAPTFWETPDIDGDTHPDWRAEAADALPTGAEPGSRLRDNYIGFREYRITATAGDQYRVIETRVGWTY